MGKVSWVVIFKNFLLKKRPLIEFPFLFFSAMCILSLIYAIVYSSDILYLVGWGFIVLSLIWLFIYIFISGYFYSEEYMAKYYKPRVRKSIEDIKILTGPELWAYLKQLDERVKAIEKTVPLRLGLFALAFSVLLVIILSLLSPLQ